MKIKVLFGLVAALALVVVAFLLLRPSGDRSGGEASAGRGSSASLSHSGPSTGVGAQQPIPPRPGTGGTGAVASRGDPDRGAPAASPDSGEPHSPPQAAMLDADALVRQRDMVKVELNGFKERIPKLKAVLERLHKSGASTPQSIEQIQTQLQQAVDAVSRLERQLPDLEDKVAKLPPPTKKGAKPAAPATP